MRKYEYYHDYSKCMLMKIFMAKPDLKNGGSIVYIDIEKALDIIRKIDNITQGQKKIIYLVGWQYDGHDDKFPDVFEVNKALKRQQDETALESLLWLIKESKKYHTVVSLHVNFNDAYEDSPCFSDLVSKKALIRDKNGNPLPIEKYNNKDCYKVSFKEDWESGMFQERMRNFFDMLPIKEMGTIHVDNFRVYNNFSPAVSTEEQIEYRNKMIDFVHELGADITTEYTYREGGKGKDGFCVHEKKYPNHCLGRIPAAWWCSQLSDQELIEILPTEYTGLINDSNTKYFLYGPMHGEDIWLDNGIDDAVWVPIFIERYATQQVPNDYLNLYKRKAICGIGLTKRCKFSDGVVSYLYNRKIRKKGVLLKEKNTLCLPLFWLDNTYFLYSDSNSYKKFRFTDIKNANAKLYKVTPQGNTFVKDVAINQGIGEIQVSPKTAYVLKILDC